jgi:Co/Zn/Cd efflux system component
MRAIMAILFINIAWCDSIDSEIIKDIDFYQSIEIVKEDNEVPLDLLAQIFSMEKINKDSKKTEDALELKK